MTVSQTFNNQSGNGIAFSAISGTEADSGATLAFLGSASQPSAVSLASSTTTYETLQWGGLNAGIGSPGATQSVTLDFTATDTNAGQLLEGLQFGVNPDAIVGTGVGFTGTLQAYSNGVLVGQSSVNDSNPQNPSTSGYSAAGDFAMTSGYSSLNMVVTLNFTDLASAPSSSYLLYSLVEAGIAQVAAPATSTITAVVFSDTNGDGIQDNGETGVAGVTVNLLNSSGAVIATTTTNAQGSYTFTETTGSYTVQVVPPSGSSISVQAAGSAAGSGGGAPGSTNYVATTGSSTTLNLVGGQAGITVDAPLYSPGAIQGTVFQDKTDSGILATGDSGVGGVTVSLFDASGLYSQTTTAANGTYSFTNLTPGTGYYVVVTPVTGDSFSPQVTETATNPDTSIVNATTGKTANITVTSGTTVSHVDAGLYAPPATGGITGVAFLDANGDGVLNSGETGVSGLTVTLYNGTTVVATTTSGTGGAYSFTGLTAGTGYTVKFAAPAGDAFTKQTAETTAAPDASLVVASTGTTGAITVVAGATTAHVDAGVYAPASVTGIAFLDTNGNGVFGTGDTGLSGVTVSLYSGTTLIATTTSGANGAYSFTGVAPGTGYSVKMATPSGDVITTQTVETTAAPDASIISASTGQTATFSLVSGQTVAHQDGGFYQPASLGGIVYNDVNKNSIQNTSETGLSGVTVTLLNGSGVSTGITTTTNASGAYSFTGLAPGSYEVKFAAPTGYTYSAQDIVAGQVDTTANASTGITSAVTLTSGQSNQTLDEGLYKSATGPSITVTKTPNVTEICSGGKVTFTFQVTNTGNQALTSVKLMDNIGTASCPDYLTPTAVTSGGYNVGDTNHDGLLGVGETWTYSLTVQENANTVQTGGGWTWVNGNGYGGCCGGCGGYWSYTCPTTTQVNTTAVDTVTASASTICTSSGGNGGCNNNNYNSCGNNTAYGFDNSGNICGFNYATTDGCGDYWNSQGQLVYTDTADNGTSKAQDFGNQWGCWGYQNGQSLNYFNSSYNGCSSVNLTTGKGCTYNSYGDSNGCNSTSVQNNSCGNLTSGGTGTTTTSTCTPTVVTATASASVEVLACNQNQITTGCTPTGELNGCYGHAEKIEFKFDPCNTVSSKVISDGSGWCTGGNGANNCFIEVTNCSNPHQSGAQVLFEGNVCAGQTFYADASTDLTGAATGGCFSTSSCTYAYVYNSQASCLAGGTPVQTICYDTTGAHQLYANDQIGSLSVCGYVGTTGHGYLAA